MAGNLLPIHEKVLKTLLIFDCLRGEDSTGIATIDKLHGAEVTVAKQLGDPFQLFNHRSYDEAMRGVHRAIIGHNRYATTGGISRATAHPFENELLVGVHNGTLTNKGELEDGWKFKVDSEALYNHIAIRGLDDAIQVADGAWSLVWWDKALDTLNFLRNKERPMWITASTNKKGEHDDNTIFWASEPWMLEQALWRHGVDHGKVIQTDADVHISIHIPNGGKLGKPVVRQMPEKLPRELPFRQPYQYEKPVGVAVGGGLKEQKQGTLTLVKEAAKEDPAKKHEAPPATVYDRGYLRAKCVSLEVLYDKVDANNGDYLVLHDAKHPFKEIRLYASDMDPVWDHINGWIEGDIKACHLITATPGKVYYTVDPTTFRVVPEEPESRFGPSKATVSKAIFDAMGLTCNWCTSPLIFGDANQFTAAKECFCPSCAASPDVKDLVKLN